MGPKKRGRPPAQKTEEQRALTAARAARSDDKTEKFHQLCELAKDTSAEDGKRLLFCNTVKEKTLSQYKSNLQPLRRWICTKHNKDFNAPNLTAEWVSEEDFTIFMAAALKMGFPLNEGIRSSLLKEQQICNLELWANKPEVIKMVTGYFYQGGNAQSKPVKGTITPEMMTALLELTLSTAPQYHDGQVVQFGVALRQCQLIDIRKGDYDPISHTLTIRKDKRLRAVNILQHKYGTHTKEVLCTHARAVLSALQDKATNVGDLLFPVANWNVKNYSRHFKSCAAALEWPPSLKWDGSHILRHGGTSNIISLCNTSDIQILRAKCVMSAATIKRYGASLAARIAKVQHPTHAQPALGQAEPTVLPELQQQDGNNRQIDVGNQAASSDDETSDDELDDLNYAPDESESEQ